MNNNAQIDIQKIKQMETNKKLGSLAIRIIIIVLCCIASFNVGKTFQAKSEADRQIKEEKETLTNNGENWKKKYLYVLKTAYCPDLTNNAYCRYYIYDINKDGIPEMLVQLGSTNDDTILDIYTIRNGESVKLANTPFSSSTLLIKDNYLFISWNQGTEQTVYKILIGENDAVKNYVEFTTKDTTYGGSFNGDKLKDSHISNLSLLEQS